MSPASWILNQVREDRWPSLLLTLSVAVAVALATLMPRVTGDLAVRSLTGALATLSAQQGDLMGQWRSGPTSDTPGDPAKVYLEAAEAVRAAQPAPLEALLRAPQLVAELGFPESVTPPPSSGYHRLTFAVLVDATLQDHAELVSGTWPQSPDPDGPVAEVVLLHEAAERLGWELGGEPIPGLRLSGTYRPVDASDPRWEHVPRGTRYAELVDPNLGTEFVSAVFLHRGALAVGASGRRPQITHRLWYGLDPSRVEMGGVILEDLSQQLTGMLARSHPLAEGSELPTVELRLFSELNSTLATVKAQQRTLSSLVMALFVGPFTLGVLLVGLASTAIQSRRRRVTALLVARGLSTQQLARMAGAEALACSLLGALLGHTTVTLLFPAPGQERQWLVSLALALILAAALPLAQSLESERSPRRGLTPRRIPRRIVAELLVLALAALAVLVALRGDGVVVTIAAAAAPVFVTLAAGALLWRVYPLPMTLLAGRVSRGRGLAGMLGVLRAVRDPAGGAVPFAAVVLGVSMASLGSVLSASLDATGLNAAWAINGAPVRVAGPRMTDELVSRIRDVEGVAGVARLTLVADSLPLAMGDGPTTFVALWAAERELLEVYRGTPLDPSLPTELFEAQSATRVILGGTTAAATGSATLGPVGPVEVLAHRPQLPGAGTQPAWALVSADRESVTGTESDTAALALISVADGAQVDAVAERLRGQLGTAVVTTAAEQLRAGHVPASAFFAQLVRGATLLTLSLMVLAVVGAELIGSRTRRQTVTRLRALGMSRRESRASVAWEVGPPLTLALLGGSALGVGLAALLLAALDYSFITGASSATFAVDPASAASIAALSLGSLLVVVLAAGGRDTRTHLEET
ncbi:MAG TPA: FtsX-like permease family protein [Arachnia sp.]|nr:FtsX-like permease family protein [Arachnia sp.]